MFADSKSDVYNKRSRNISTPLCLIKKKIYYYISSKITGTWNHTFTGFPCWRPGENFGNDLITRIASRSQ